MPDDLTWRAIVAITACTAFVAVVCALAAHHGCTDPGPPVRHPDPGTPRADYCGAIDDGASPALIVLAAVGIVALAGIALRRRPWWAALIAGLVLLAVAADAVLASSLTFAYTI